MEELYWKTRCLLAEKYIEESPCDPDIYDAQIQAYNNWQAYFKMTPKNININHLVAILKNTLESESVNVIFETKEMEFDYILDICNSFRSALESS